MRAVQFTELGKDLEDDEEGSPHHGSDSSESEVSSLDSEAALEVSRARVSQLRELAEKQNRGRTTCRAQCGLAVSVATWVAIFGVPMYHAKTYKNLFGYRGSILDTISREVQRKIDLGEVDKEQDTEGWTDYMDKLRITCRATDRGMMRNLARGTEEVKLATWEQGMSPWNEQENVNDIWCGRFNQHYLDYWPNVAQLIIFSVFQNTGTTLNLAWQGIVGTYFACLNAGLMQIIYPLGAKGFPCGSAKSGFMTIIRRHGVFFWHTENDLYHAREKYNDNRHRGGVDLVAIFQNDGSIVGDYKWYTNEKIWNKTLSKFRDVRGADCVPGTIVHADKNYNQWVCLLNVIGVLFLFLISRSAVNTIMFGMSWHVSFMLDFMNPNIGAEPCEGLGCALSISSTVHSAVFKTTLIGAAVSILAVISVSLFLPISNLWNLEADSTAMTKAVTGIWNDGLEYLLTARRRSARRFHIAREILEVQDMVAKAGANADGAWWETLDMGPCGDRRRLLKEYDLWAADIRDMLNCMANCIVTEDFQGPHMAFCATMQNPMLALLHEVEELMYMTLQACKDGVVSGEDSKAIQCGIREVKHLQVELFDAFRKATPELSRDLAEEVISAFALSFWARKLTEFSEHVAATKRAPRLRRLQNAMQGIWQSLCNTWSFQRMFCDREHFKFASRNCASISIVFLIAYFMPSGSVFVQYSATMPATLTLLLVSDGTQLGSMIHKNFNRLLAVVLGKVFPVMIAWVLYFFPCLSVERFIIQGCATWLYVYIFTYIYYASPAWGYVGCLIAGFGVYQLLTPCNGDPSGTFESRYQEIGAVTFAILVQGLVHTVLSHQSPVQLQLEALQELGQIFQQGYEAFFNSDLQSVQAAAQEAGNKLAQAKNLLPECNPKLKVCKFDERDFKLELCVLILRILEQMLCDLNLLIIAAKDWVPNESVKHASAAGDVIALLNSQPSMANIRHELMTTLERTNELVLSTLRHEGKVSRDLIDAPANQVLEAAPALYGEINEKLRGTNVQSAWKELTSDACARINVMVRALENTQARLFQITEKCLAD